MTVRTGSDLWTAFFGCQRAVLCVIPRRQPLAAIMKLGRSRARYFCVRRGRSVAKLGNRNAAGTVEYVQRQARVVPEPFANEHLAPGRRDASGKGHAHSAGRRPSEVNTSVNRRTKRHFGSLYDRVTEGVPHCSGRVYISLVAACQAHDDPEVASSRMRSSPRTAAPRQVPVSGHPTQFNVRHSLTYSAQPAPERSHDDERQLAAT